MSKKKSNPFSDSQYPIYDGKFWGVILNRDGQTYLGRSIVYLKNRFIDDPLLLTKEEREELWTEILPKLASALKKAFKPDRINYSHLANSTHHVHWHIVPRYEKNSVRKFADETFKDERAGHNYTPEVKKTVSKKIMEKICMEIRKNF